MSSVDNRVVNMQFNNRDFASKIADTMVSLQKLDKALQFEKGVAGLNDVEQSMNGMDFSGMETGIQAVANRFSTLGIIGMAVITRLTNGIIDFGKSLGSKIISGGISRAMNIEQAKFMIEGLDKSWAKLHEDMEYAVQDTAFGLDSAAKAAAQLSASNIEAGDSMKTALRGISGVAAMTGQSYDDIANIFTKVAGQGRLMGDDLLSMGNRGLNAAADLGKAMGKTEKEIRDMVSKGKISFEEFAKIMDDKYGKHSKEANRTFTGSLSNVNAALSKLGEGFVTPFIRNKELEDQTYNLIDVLNTFKQVIYNVKDILADFGLFDEEDLEKNTITFGKWSKAVQKGSEILTRFLDLFTGARSEFGKKNSLETRLEEFRKVIGMSEPDFNNLKDTIAGIGAVFKIFGNIIQSFVTAIFPSFKSGLADTGSGILSITGAIGRWLIELEKVVNESKALDVVMSGIAKVLKTVGGAITYFVDKIAGVASGVKIAGPNLKGFNALLDALKDKLKPIGDLASTVFDKIKNGLDGIFNDLAKAINTVDANKLYSLLNIGLSGGVGFTFITFLNNMNKTLQGFLDGISFKRLESNGLTGFEKFFSGLSFAIGDLQKNIKANTIMQIAKAIAVLAGSLFVLSLINPERLFTALGGLQVLLLDVMEIVGIINKMTTAGGFQTAAVASAIMTISISLIAMAAAVKLLSTIPLENLAAGLVGLSAILLELDLFLASASGFDGKTVKKAASAMLKMSVALILMSVAVKQLGSMNIEELAKGLVGIGALLLELAAFMLLTQNIKVGKGGFGLLLMSAALVVMAKAVKTIGKLNPEQLAKGLTGLGFVLLELAAFIKLTSGAKGILLAAAGMLVLSYALKGLTESLQTMGNMSEEQMAKGLLTLAGSLLIIAGAMQAMPKNMVTVSAGLFIAAQAISTIAAAMASMGGMSAEEMAKSLISMAGALAILAVAMNAMNSALAGAAAMIVAAAAIALLVPPLVALSSIPIAGIITALAALAGVFVVLGVAGSALGPMLPIIIGLSAAVALLGVGMIAAGAGVMVFVTALMLAAQNFNLIVAAIPAFLAALTQSITAISAFGVKLIMALFEGIANNIGKIVTIAADIVVNFINAIAEKLPDIIDAGMNLAISFINGIADGINDNGAALRAAIGNLIGSIVNFVIESFQELLSKVPGVGKEIAEALEPAKKAAKDFFGDGKVADETKKGADKVAKAADSGTKKAKDSVNKNLKGMPKSAKNTVKEMGISFDDLPKTIDKPVQQMVKNLDASKGANGASSKTSEAYIGGLKKGKYKETGTGIGKETVSGASAQSLINSMNSGGGSLGTGYVNGIKAKWDDSYNAGYTLGSKAKQGEKDATKHSSPSKVFYKAGQYIGQGYVNGISSFFGNVYKAGSELGMNSVEGMSKTVRSLSNRIKETVNTAPTIRPVMDLSNVKMGVDSINSMFDKNQYALGIAGSLSTDGLLSSKNITFNNNITVDGAENPSQFADEFIQELMIQARTV